MNNLDKQYQILLKTILEFGVDKKDRTGTGTKSIFGYTIRHKMSDGFPLLTTKKMAWKTMVTELLWFLRGDTNIKFLVDNNCHIWDGDAWKNYQHKASKEDFLKDGVLRYEEFVNKIKTDDEFAKQWGELGPVYGKQWRNWGYDSDKWREDYNKLQFGSKEEIEHLSKKGIDQIANLISNLKTNPDSRRLMVNAWNVGELDQMVLPPCHYGFQVYTRELTYSERNLLYVEKFGETVEDTDAKWELNTTDTFEDDLNKSGIPKRAISLMWNQRSVDTFLGLPFNIASYGLLLEIIAKTVNMVPDELIGNLGDVHLYSNHIEQAKEQIGRELSLYERIDWWFKNNKPNRDVVEEIESSPSNVQEKYFDGAGVPKHTRQPYPLPTLKHMKTDDFYKSLSEDVSLFTHLDITDFVVDGYQSHPTIKAPLSN